MSPESMGLTGKGMTRSTAESPRLQKNYDKQQPQHDVATSHNAFRFITTTVDWRNCLFIRL
ncbi:MAG: hypothetical protein E6Q52_12520 [Methylophilus sp.]|nr:MAG: hypothetical protein E6Q52_12520 [Methylophilus sp.]